MITAIWTQGGRYAFLFGLLAGVVVATLTLSASGLLKTGTTVGKMRAFAKQFRERELKPGDVVQDCRDVCPEMVVVPPGRFVMGDGGISVDSDRGPPHDVTIGQALLISRFEVTFEQWDACVDAQACRPVPDEGWGRERRPAINIDWVGANEYVHWLSRITGRTYRLLTEAEWEYAARAGTTTLYSWDGVTGTQKANCRGCGTVGDNNRTVPVGSFEANTFGLFDMHGNAWEWTQDCWNQTYHGAPGDGSARLSGACAGRVLRGGSYTHSPDQITATYRHYYPSSIRERTVGLRVARNLDR